MADIYKIERRVAGYHDIRLDGMVDLVSRARGASVLDVGCNRGLVGFELANNGAKLVHGCDNYALGIQTATELFADLRAVQSKFVVTDLTKGKEALAPFGDQRYDIVLMLATYHKLSRVMSVELLSGLMRALGEKTIKYFGWRGYEAEITVIDNDMRAVGMKRIHTSFISEDLGPAAVWAR